MAGSRVIHQLGNNEGMDPVLSLFIDRPVILVLCRQSAAACAQYDSSIRCECIAKLQAGLRNRLFRSDQSELREPIIERLLLPIEPAISDISTYLPADLDRESLHVANVELADPAAPFTHSFKSVCDAVPKWVDRASPCDDDAPHQPVCSPTSFSTAEMIEDTEEISKSDAFGSFALNGT